MSLLKQYLYIFMCLFVGSLLKQVIPAPIPTTVYGMILLFFLFASHILQEDDLDQASKPLLSYLAFFFIPAGVALMEQFEVLKGNYLQIFLAILVSTLLTLLVTGHTVQYVIKKGEKK